MSVLIKGMDIPKSCLECITSGLRTAIACAEWTEISAGEREIYRSLSCPLVELPEKHGRLIDGDVLWDAMSKYNDNEGAKMPFGYDDTSIHIDSACFVIENAPTIIEAEGE